VRKPGARRRFSPAASRCSNAYRKNNTYCRRARPIYHYFIRSRRLPAADDGGYSPPQARAVAALNITAAFRQRFPPPSHCRLSLQHTRTRHVRTSQTAGRKQRRRCYACSQLICSLRCHFRHSAAIDLYASRDDTPRRHRRRCRRLRLQTQISRWRQAKHRDVEAACRLPAEGSTVSRKEGESAGRGRRSPATPQGVSVTRP